MRSLLAALASSLLLAPPAHATFLSNGGFEDPAVEGATSVTDWDFSGDGGLRTERPDQFEGLQFARLGFSSTFSGGQAVALAQDFDVSAAGDYELSFAFQLRESFCACDDLFANSIFDVSIDGTSVTDGDLADSTDYSFGDIDDDWRSTRWDVEHFALSLVPGTHTLDFRFSRSSSIFGRNYQLGLDGVQLTAAEPDASVPEPSSLALLGAAAAGLVGVSRRRVTRAARAR